MGTSRKPTKLNPKQERFVAEYSGNATEAAKKAGYSARSAKQTAAELMANPLVAAAIAAKMARLTSKHEVTSERIIAELARIAFLDPRKVMSWGPDGVRFARSDELTDDEAACVVEASETVTEAGGTIRVKLADKLGALSLLAKIQGLLVDRVKVDGTATLEIVEEIVDGPASPTGTEDRPQNDSPAPGAI